MRAIRWWIGLAIAALHGTLALAQTAPPLARSAAQLAPPIGSGWSRQEQLSLECAPDSASCNVSP